jgi:hypothetical protein
VQATARLPELPAARTSADRGALQPHQWASSAALVLYTSSCIIHT